MLAESDALTEADTLVLKLALADRDSLTLSDAKSFSLAKADALVLNDTEVLSLVETDWLKLTDAEVLVLAESEALIEALRLVLKLVLDE